MFTLWFDTLPIDGIAEELRGMRATPSLFRVLQGHPALGRTFTDAEGEIGADQKIILSHGLWQRLYGGDTTVIGRDLRLGWTGQPLHHRRRHAARVLVLRPRRRRPRATAG